MTRVAPFISLEGIDGTGKSTQCRLLASWLQSQGISVQTCNDPGGTALGDRLRAILLDEREHLSLRAEALLFMASRAELVEKIIRPALATGKCVLSDRYLLSNVVYQGHAGGIDPAELWQVGRLATGGLLPHLTLVLDLPIDEAARRRGRDPDRMENRDMVYRERVRQGFLEEAKRDPQRFRVIDASTSIEQVQKLLRDQIEPLLQSL